MPSSTTIERVASLPTGAKFYRPQGAVRDLFYSHAPEVLIEGPAGTGKSRGVLEKLYALCFKYPRMRAAIVRKTRESISQAAQVTWEQEVMDPPEVIHLNHERQEYKFPNGATVILGGMDKASKVLSTQYDFIYVQEATETTLEDIETLSTRLRNGVVPYQQLVMDCNPGPPDHWLNQRAIAGKCQRLLSRHTDNPSVTQAYLERLQSLTGYLRDRLYLGLWVAAEGMFFHEWDPRVHIVKPFEIPASWTRWCAIDYGFADPFCALWFTRDPEDRSQVFVYREAYAKGLRDEQQGQAIAQASHGERISWYVTDPSCWSKRREQNRPSIANVYHAQGLRPIAPGYNERIPGWNVVRRALAFDLEAGKLPKLQVFEGRAPNLIRTLPSMVHDPLDSEDLADKLQSVKTEDHAVDCLRYGLCLEAMPPQQQAKLQKFQFGPG